MGLCPLLNGTGHWGIAVRSGSGNLHPHHSQGVGISDGSAGTVPTHSQDWCSSLLLSSSVGTNGGGSGGTGTAIQSQNAADTPWLTH